MIWAGPGPISRFYDPVPVRRCKKYRFLTKMHKGVKRISVESSQSNAVSEESSRQEVQKVLFLLWKMHKGVKRMSEESSQSNGVSEESSQYPLRLGPLCLWAVRRTVNEQNI